MQQPQQTSRLFIATCIIYMVILTCFVFLRIISSAGWLDWMPTTAAEITFSLLTQVVLMTLVPIFGMIIYNRKFRAKKDTMSFSEFMQTSPDNMSSETKTIMQSWRFKKPSAQIIMWSILLGVVCFLFNIFVSSFFNGILSYFGHRGATGGGGGGLELGGVAVLFLMLFLTAVLPGICEEVTHRGLLIRGFMGRIGIMNAITLSSVLFGLMHLNIVQVFFAAILGYFMALAAMAVRNIWPAIIIHFMNNAFAVYFMFAGHYGWIGGNFFSVLGNFLGNTLFLVYIGFFVGLYFAMVAIIHKLARDKFTKDNASRPEPRAYHRGAGLQAIKYYITIDEVKSREPLNRVEKTLIYGIVFLGVVVTTMTLVWGFL